MWEGGFMFFIFAGKSDQQDALRHVLKSCHYYLAENMVLTELIPWLQSCNVLTNHEAESITSCVTSFKQNCCLLECLQRKSSLQLDTFIQGLIECNQTHLAQHLDPEGNGQ